MKCHHRMYVTVCVSVASLLVLCDRAAGFNPQPEPPGKWYVEGYIEMWAEAVEPIGAEPFGIDPAIISDGMMDFMAGVIARFNAPSTADDKPVDGLYDAEFEHFLVRIGDTTWDQTMPGTIQFQVNDGVVNGCLGSYTVTLPAHPDLSFALPASPGTWEALDERGEVNLGTVTGTYSLRDAAIVLYGDMDCDSDVDGDDIQPFVLALTNPSQYASDFPGCDRLNGDCDKDGDLDGDDIQPFVDVLTSGQQPTQAVPEPATLSLLALGALAVVCRRKR